jgi:ABC-type glycerol-3-phosphate transport system substrate-binding protein
MIQAYDEYLNGSTVPWADKAREDMLAVVRGQCELEGKMLAFPIDFDQSGIGYRKDLFDAVGADGVPGTWVELGEIAAAIRAKFKDDNVYGISSSAAWFLYGGPGAMFYNTCTQVFDDQDIIRFDAEEFLQALDLCKSWADRDITATPFGSLSHEHWISGKLGVFWNQHPLAIWAQKNLGKQAVSDPQPLPSKEKGSGCLVWAICYGLANQAPHPQEFVDYLVHTFYPGSDEGLVMTKAICDSGKLPAYQRAYDEVVNKEPGLAWMIDMGDIARRAVPPPMLTTASIQTDRFRAWAERFFAGEMPAKEAMDGCLEEIHDEISKMLEEGVGRGT